MIFFIQVTTASAESMNTDDPIRGTSQFCTNDSEFAAAVIQPNNETGYTLLQCKNATGSSYYIDLNAIHVADTDSAWIKVPYPKAWACFGNQPEDCKYSK